MMTGILTLSAIQPAISTHSDSVAVPTSASPAQRGSIAMYLARFSYDVLPVNRQRAVDFIRREVEAARANRLNARMLVPLTRGHGDDVALQFEVELTKLDQLDQFRQRGIGSREGTSHCMHAFIEAL